MHGGPEVHVGGAVDERGSDLCTCGSCDVCAAEYDMDVVRYGRRASRANGGGLVMGGASRAWPAGVARSRRGRPFGNVYAHVRDATTLAAPDGDRLSESLDE